MKDFVEGMEEDTIIYLSEENADMTGVGADVYRFDSDESEEDEEGCYLYYGDFVNGKREGLGSPFVNEGEDQYQVFSVCGKRICLMARV